MNYYLLAIALVFTACKTEETRTTSTDSLGVAIDRDTNVDRTATDTLNPISAEDTITVSKEKGSQLLPVDEASKDPSFLKFRSEMIRAVEAKNADALIAMLDSNIRLSFGGSGGLADFRKDWKPQDKNSPLWSKLEWVLKHGGSFRNKMFWAPYVYSNWPESGPEPFENGVIVGDNVPVFEKADATSARIAALDHHFVKVIDGGHLREKSPEFVKIKTPSGKTGFVRSTQIRSQLDYRAGFEKRNGQWRMSTFIAGD